MERFRNRFEAGEALGQALHSLRRSDPVVIGLARGGVEVAFEVAKALSAPLKVLVVRKVGAPGHPEYGVGAVAPGGISVFDSEVIGRLGLHDGEVRHIAEREAAEVERRLSAYSDGRELSIEGRCAVLVDDGIATGLTSLAAVRYARSLRPARLVFAVPVASEAGLARIRREVDDLIALAVPPFFYAVGAWYDAFEQTADEDVLTLLRENSKTAKGYAS